MNTLLFCFLTLGFSSIALAQSHSKDMSPDKHSNYRGEETRAIKSLSMNDIEELQRGAGWGLAKAAELNGVPGPLHLLELKSEIDLTAIQINKLTEIFDQMRAKAIESGKELVEQERQLDELFRSELPSQAQLNEQLSIIGQLRTKLRSIHLSAHLKTPAILTKHQIKQYNELRGYKNADPCKNIPEGHSEEMWKRHNGCE